MKEIVQDGAPVLREVARPVPESMFGTKELDELLKDMTEALDREPDGVALAAPQINESLRVFIVRVDRTLPPPPIPEGEDPAKASRKEPKPHVDVYINPEIVKTSRRRSRADEGCLSVRGIYGTTNRHERVTIRAQHPDSTHFTRGAGGLLAQIFEHEIDHLNGILFTDGADNLVHIEHTHDGGSED